METNASFTENYLRILSRLFEGLDKDILYNILNLGKKHHIEPGAYLFRQSVLENSLYIVLAGRLRAVVEDEKGLHILGDIGEGEPVGEFAIFTNEPRMASVLAIRRTVVLEITKEEYLHLVSQAPSFAITLTSLLIKRLKRNFLEEHKTGTHRNIALINLQADHDLGPWTSDIERTLVESGYPIQIYDHESMPEEAYKTVFESLEQSTGLNILVCSEACPEWSRQCLIYADLVIVATLFTADPGLYQIEKVMALYTQNILNKRIYLVLLHENETGLPRHTSRWLAERKVNLHIHIRKHHLLDVRRFCRIISNQAVGVVLGGGGAKGYAHVGAVRALLDAGVEIDFVGGTSAGGLYSIAMSYCDFDLEKVDAICADSVRRKLTSNDYSLPLVSLLSGRKVKKYIKEMFGETELEDIWVNSYCVSTNFSSSSIQVHDRGLASKMVQASIAIPGIFPPVVIDQQLHVDGCVVDNLPIEPMYRYPVRHVIAISLSSISASEVDYTEIPSVGKLIWDKLTRKKQYRVPSIASVIIDSLILNSRQKQEATKAKTSLYFEMDLNEIGLMDDKKWKQTLAKGHEQMRAFLEGLPDKEKFWLKPFMEEEL